MKTIASRHPLQEECERREEHERREQRESSEQHERREECSHPEERGVLVEELGCITMDFIRNRYGD